MRILEVKNWKKVALHRDEWAKLLRRPGPTKGCRANDDDDDDDNDDDDVSGKLIGPIFQVSIKMKPDRLCRNFGNWCQSTLGNTPEERRNFFFLHRDGSPNSKSL